MLTHGTIEKAVREGERVRLNDGKGLMLAVSAKGRASWMLRVQHGGRRRDYGLGSYPALSHSDARHKADDTREAIRAGHDPISEKRRPSMPTLRDAAAAVIACKAKGWRSPKHAEDWRRSLERHAAALMSARVDGITRADVLATLQPLWETQPSTARAVRQRLRAAFGWATAFDHIAVNVAGEGIDAALPARPRQRSHHAALPAEQVGPALRAVDASEASESARLAVRFLALTATRSAETTGATLERGRYAESATFGTIPAARMKAGREHRVPLSSAAMAVLEGREGSLTMRAAPTSTRLPTGRLASLTGKPFGTRFSGRTSPPRRTVSEPVFPKHGAAETGQRWDAAETALAHAIGSDTERSYQRCDLLSERRGIMEAWGAYITS